MDSKCDMASLDIPLIDPGEQQYPTDMAIDMTNPTPTATVVNVKKAHRCPYEGCNSAFNRPYRLAQHLLVHNNIKAFKCPEENCTKAYTNKSHLDRHITKTHRGVKEEDVIYVCPTPTCLKKYSNRQNLKRHIKVKHKPTFKCDTCGEVFRKKHLLSSHMYDHGGVKAFSCDFCDKTFVRLSDKKKHLRNHRTHKCPECQKKFNYWSRLQKHLKNDHGRDYVCDNCGRTFKQRSHMLRHVKIHDTSRVFTCPYENCKRFYSRNSNLRQHIMIYHEKVLHECHICQARLSTKAKLQNHIVVIHESPKVRVYKTKATGRKVRKDFGTIRKTTAMKLSGLPITATSQTIKEQMEEPETAMPSALPPVNKEDVSSIATAQEITRTSRILTTSQIPITNSQADDNEEQHVMKYLEIEIKQESIEEEE